MYINRPAAAPLAAPCVPGIKQANVMIMLAICPTVPHRNIFRLPALSIMNQEVVAKAEYTIIFTPPMIKLMWRVCPIDFSKRMGK